MGVGRVLETSASHSSFGPRARIRGSKLISFHIPLSPVGGKGKEGHSGGGERGYGFRDPAFLSVPPAHPDASQASLENRDLRPSFPLRKGLRESRVGSLGGWGLWKLWAGDRAGRRG